MRLALLVAVTGLATGCTGIELGALGAAAMSAGVGNAVRAGTEYTMTGTAYRTFSLPLEDLARVVRETLTRLDLPVTEAVAEDEVLRFRAEGIERTVQLSFTPISTSVTRLGISVKQGIIQRDRATASEIVAQIEQTVLAAAQSKQPAAALKSPRR
jgi:hypothetical protein